MSAINDTEFIRLFGKITPEDKETIRETLMRKDIFGEKLPKSFGAGFKEGQFDRMFERILKSIKSKLAVEARRQLKEEPKVSVLLQKGKFPKNLQQKSIVEILRKEFKSGDKDLDRKIKEKTFSMGKIRREMSGQKLTEIPLPLTYYQTNSVSVKDAPQNTKNYFPYIYDYTTENSNGEVGKNIFLYPYPAGFAYFKNTGLDLSILAEYKRIFNNPRTLKGDWNKDPFLSSHLGRAKIIITPGGNLGLEQKIRGKTYNLLTSMPYNISSFMACMVWGGAESVCNAFFVEGILHFHFHTKKNSAIVNNYPALATPQTAFIPVQQTLQVPGLGGAMVNRDLLVCYDFTLKNNLGKIPVFTIDTQVSLITKQQTQTNFKLSKAVQDELKLKATLGNIYLTKDDMVRAINPANTALLRVGFAVNVLKHGLTETQRYFIFH